ncbi:MAG: hypothetical protein K9W42_10700 [Candidatus Heimdallarchaeota archaeon]|nr:hypothetical protein [Candidatus Heimdallarchaeota archaeon]
MKKSWKILLPVLTLGLLIGAKAVSADYTVKVGDIFYYDIIRSEQSISIGINSVSNDTFRLGGHYFPEGTTVTLNITEVDPLGVDYNMSADGYSTVKVILETDKTKLETYVLRPLTLLEEVCLTSWNQTTFNKKHLGALLLPFLKPDNATWETWKDYAYEIYNNGIFLTETFHGDLTVDATYTNTSDVFLFEFIMRGQLSDTLSASGVQAVVDVTITHKYQFAYEPATGIMLGIRMEGSISGTTNGTLLNIEYSYHTEKQGYNLPNYQLDKATWPLAGYTMGVAFVTITFIVATIVVLKKYTKSS